MCLLVYQYPVVYKYIGLNLPNIFIFIRKAGNPHLYLAVCAKHNELYGTTNPFHFSDTQSRLPTPIQCIISHRVMGLRFSYLILERPSNVTFPVICHWRRLHRLINSSRVVGQNIFKNTSECHRSSILCTHIVKVTSRLSWYWWEGLSSSATMKQTPFGNKCTMHNLT